MLLIAVHRDRDLETALPLLRHLQAGGGPIGSDLCRGVRVAERRGWVRWEGHRLMVTEAGMRALGEGGA